MLKVYIYNNKKIYEIKNNYLNETGILTTRNVHNVLVKYQQRNKRRKNHVKNKHKASSKQSAELHN